MPTPSPAPALDFVPIGWSGGHYGGTRGPPGSDVTRQATPHPEVLLTSTTQRECHLPPGRVQLVRRCRSERELGELSDLRCECALGRQPFHRRRSVEAVDPVCVGEHVLGIRRLCHWATMDEDDDVLAHRSSSCCPFLGQ